MTNAEKFAEMFGTDLQRQCSIQSWWDQEYIPTEAESEDAISRANTIDEISRIILDHPLDGYEDGQLILKTIQNMPPVNTAEKVGRWEKVTAENRDGSISWWYACSECGAPCPKTDYGTDYFGSYCSECGSRMRQARQVRRW